MSTFEDKNYRWRETYFVLFDASKRPKMKNVLKALHDLNPRYEIVNPLTDEQGAIESLTVVSADDFAALDLCYIEGDEVLEMAPELVRDLKKSAADAAEPVPYEKILRYNGRIDVLHFERVADEPEEPDEEEMLDPSALLVVLEALAELTGGVAVDPQSGTVLG
jgi:hypothetical protein